VKNKEKLREKITKDHEKGLINLVFVYAGQKCVCSDEQKFCY
jgi:hypothetical protein